MAKGSRKFTFVINAKNKASKVLNGFRGQLAKIGSFAKKIFSPTGIIAGGLAALGVGKLAGSFVETASAFENLEASLTTTTGSLEKAREAIKYANEEAAASPFTVMEYADAIRSLTAYGIDYQSVMTTLGDTAASMGKPLMQAVEAFSDALQGEGERLKEFGIKQSVAGDQITYTWTDTMGKVRKTVAKNSPDIIAETLKAIWNEKYQGGMAKFAATWTGLTSTLKSIWDEFKLAVMEAGVFEYLKSALSLLIEKINEAKKSGDFKKWAAAAGEAITNVIRMLIVNFPKALIGILEIGYKISEIFTGWKLIFNGLKQLAYALGIVLAEIVDAFLAGITKALEAVNVGGKFDEAISQAKAGRQANGQVIGRLDNGLAQAVAEQGKILSEQRDNSATIAELKKNVEETQVAFDNFVKEVEASVAAKKADKEATSELTSELTKLYEIEKKISELKRVDLAGLGPATDRSGFSLGDIREGERTE